MYKTLVTDVGAAALVAAISGGQSYVINQMAVGDGGGVATVPNGSETALVNELYRGNLSLLAVHPERPNQLIAEFPASAVHLEGETLREAVLLDNTGTVFAVANLPDIVYPTAAQGAARDAMIRMVFEVTNAADFTLIIDPNVIYATQQWVMESSSSAAMLDGPTQVFPGQHVQYQITNYHSFFDYTVNMAAANAATVMGDVIVVDIDPAATNSVTLGVTAQGYYREVTIVVLAEAVITPSITAPGNNEQVSAYPELASSAFSVYPNGGDSHAQSQWQLATDAAFSTIVVDHTSAVDLLSYGGFELPLGQTYYMRLRHQGVAMGWSEWSATVAVVTAGSDWLLWDGANDGPAWQVPDNNGGNKTVLETIVINDTDLIVVTAEYNASMLAYYLRRNGLVFDLLGVTDLAPALSNGEGSRQQMKAFVQNGQLVFFVENIVAGEIKMITATVDPILGGISIVGNAQVIMTGLVVAPEPNLEVLRNVVRIDAQRFVVLTSIMVGGVAPAGPMASRMVGVYLDPSTGNVVTGGVVTLDAAVYVSDICVVDGDLFATAAHKNAELHISTWRMPGVTMTLKSSWVFADVDTMPTQGGRLPMIQLLALDDHTLLLLSATTIGLNVFVFFVQLNLVGDEVVSSYYSLDTTQFSPSNVHGYIGLRGSNRMMINGDRSVVFVGPDLQTLHHDHLRITATNAGLITTPLVYLGTPDIAIVGMLTYRVTNKPMTDSLRVYAGREAFEIMLLNGER